MAKKKVSEDITAGLFGTNSQIEEVIKQPEVRSRDIKEKIYKKAGGRPRASDLALDEKTFKTTYYTTADIQLRLKLEVARAGRTDSEIIRRLIRDNLPNV